MIFISSSNDFMAYGEVKEIIGNGGKLRWRAGE